MPAFMENMFSFGFREHGLDCNETSFHANHHLNTDDGGVRVPVLGRSGQQLQHCYGLRSVERSSGQVNWPWSVRQCSIYHSLDLQSAQATWIVVKANRLIEKYARDAMKSSSYRDGLEPDNVARAILASFAIHELVASWSGSNWQSYITFIENRLQGITRPALSVTTEDVITAGTGQQATHSTSTVSPAQTTIEECDLDEKPTPLKKTQSSFKSFSRRVTSFATSRTPSSKEPVADALTVLRQRFSFNDLPRLHFLEEKANEALDVLCNNVEVLEALKEDYGLIKDTVLDTAAYDQFTKAVYEVQRKFKTQQARLRQLLRLLADRKALVSTLLPLVGSLAYRLSAPKDSGLRVYAGE